MNAMMDHSGLTQATKLPHSIKEDQPVMTATTDPTGGRPVREISREPGFSLALSQATQSLAGIDILTDLLKDCHEDLQRESGFRSTAGEFSTRMKDLRDS